MKNIKVAFLDTGISEIDFLKNKKIIRLEIDSNGKIENRKNNSLYLNHATICAALLFGQVNDLIIYDIKVLSKQGNGKRDTLIRGLLWCLQSDISIIHLSLGTLQFQDYLFMKHIINKIIKKNIIIVAAYHNKDIVSYPADIPYVIGVRCDKEKKVKYGEVLCDDLKKNKYIINTAEYLKELGIIIQNPLCNSYAVPIMVSQIIKFMQSKDYYSVIEVLHYLYCKSIHCDNMKNKIEVVCDMKYESKAVKIFWSGQDEQVFNNICLQLQLLGYEVGIVGNSINNYMLPINKVMNRGKIDKVSLDFFDYIQGSDIIFVFCKNVEKKIIEYDCFNCIIEEAEGKFVFYNKNFFNSFTYPIQLILKIIEWLEDDKY